MLGVGPGHRHALRHLHVRAVRLLKALVFISHGECLCVRSSRGVSMNASLHSHAQLHAHGKAGRVDALHGIFA